MRVTSANGFLSRASPTRYQYDVSNATHARSIASRKRCNDTYPTPTHHRDTTRCNHVCVRIARGAVSTTHIYIYIYIYILTRGHGSLNMTTPRADAGCKPTGLPTRPMATSTPWNERTHAVHNRNNAPRGMRCVPNPQTVCDHTVYGDANKERRRVYNAWGRNKGPT